MQKHGLKTIINLRESEENHLWESRICDSLGIQYYHIPMDGREVPDTADLNTVLRVIENQRKPTNNVSLFRWERSYRYCYSHLSS